LGRNVLSQLRGVRQKGMLRMSKKKKSRKRKNKMPPALKKYWAKLKSLKLNRKRKKTNPKYHRASTVMPRFKRKTLRSRSGKKVRKPAMARAILLSKLRREGYTIAPKPNPRRRRRKSTSLKKAHSVRLKGRYTATQLKSIKRALARASGRRVVLK